MVGPAFLKKEYFFEKVKNDEDLAKRLSEAQDSESKLEIARQEGFEFELEDAMKAKDKLSEDELTRWPVVRIIAMFSLLRVSIHHPCAADSVSGQSPGK